MKLSRHSPLDWSVVVDVLNVYLPCRAQVSRYRNYAFPPPSLHAPQLAGRALLVHGGLGVSQRHFPSH